MAVRCAPWGAVTCCRAGGRPAAARRAGLEFVEKVLTIAMVALLDGAERDACLPSAVAQVSCWDVGSQ